MTPRLVTFGWLKVLYCLAIVMALAISPPSVAHAGSGAHDGHHSISVQSHRADLAKTEPHLGHVHHAAHIGLGDGAPADSEKNDQQQQANSCCNGICVSATVLDEDQVLPPPVSTEEYSVLIFPTDSIGNADFLRPPRILI